MIIKTGIVVSVDGVTKRYGRVVALDKVSFSVRHGSIHALLGHNGAGKTTAIRLVAGLLKPSKGSVSVFGGDPYREPRVKAWLGYAGEYGGLYGSLSVMDNLWRFCTLKIGDAHACTGEIEWISGELHLHDILDRKVAELSAGNRQRVALARAFIGSPKLVLLDEPLNRLDPVWRRRIKGFLRRYATKRRASILFSSHILSDVEEIADEVTILMRGRVVYNGSLKELFHSAGSVRVKIGGDRDVLRTITQEFGDNISNIHENNEYLVLNFASIDEAYNFLEYIARNRIRIELLEMKRTTLEDIYLEYYLEGVSLE
ncbi:MAG: ABC transporter ATP-binding protein [Desulfurococcales archaeon]|nr:ABC transporter ATP-binding protein [Desulfurococcales archaeon]